MALTPETSVPAGTGAQPGLLQLGGFSLNPPTPTLPVVVLTAGQANPTSNPGEVAPVAG